MEVEVIEVDNVTPVAITRRKAFGVYTIQNLGSNAIYGGLTSSVTTATGFKIAAGASYVLPEGHVNPVYLIAETAAQTSPADTRVAHEATR